MERGWVDGIRGLDFGQQVGDGGILLSPNTSTVCFEPLFPFVVDDDVEILQVQKPEPLLVDLACEESKSYYLNHVKPLKCWCKSNLHKRTVHKHRAWALRLDVCEWTDVKRCALCKRRSKSFLTNVVHLSAHFKCARKFCDWCGVGFLNRKFLLEHQKRCQLRFHGVKEMRVLIKVSKIKC